MPRIALLALSLILVSNDTLGRTPQAASWQPLPASTLQAGGGVPRGFMILGETAQAPAGFSFTGLTLRVEPDEVGWSACRPLLLGRRELGAAVVDRTLYAIGGWNGTPLSSVEAYDPDADVWNPAAPMPTARLRLSTVALGQRIYAMGGYDSRYLSTVEMYEPETDTWHVRASMPTPRGMFATIVVNGRILAIGGYDGVALSVVEEYDPTTDSWSSKPPLPAICAESTGVYFEGAVYAIGGDNGFQPTSTILSMVPPTGPWSSRIGPTLYDHGAAVLGGSIYAFGGNTGSGATTATLRFDSHVVSWNPAPSMATPRQTHGFAVLDDRIYAIGGHNDSNGALASVEAFSPTRVLFVHQRD